MGCATSTRWNEYVPVGPLKGPSGLQQFPESPYSLIGTGKYIITKDCKNPEAAFRLADLMYSYEATLRNAIGRPGEEWEDSTEGAELIVGGQAKYKVSWSPTEGEQTVSWNQAAPAYRSAEFRLAQEFNPADPLERYLYNWSKEIYAPYGKPDMKLPPLVFTSEQSQKLGEIRTALTALVGPDVRLLRDRRRWTSTPSWDSSTWIELKNNGLDEYLRSTRQPTTRSTRSKG